MNSALDDDATVDLDLLPENIGGVLEVCVDDLLKGTFDVVPLCV